MNSHLEGSTTRQLLHSSSLNFRDFCFLRSCTIGDGWIGFRGKSSYFLRIGHSSKQLEWLQWKADRINQIFGINNPVLGPYNVSDSKGGQHLKYIYSVFSRELFSEWFDNWYIREKDLKTRKLVLPSLLDGLGLEDLAVLWCDDGSLWSIDRTKKHVLKSGITRYYKYRESSGSIATCSFTLEENEMLANWIYQISGVRPLVSRSSGYLLLRFCKSKLKKLIPQIKPFVPPCMAYKVDLSKLT